MSDVAPCIFIGWGIFLAGVQVGYWLRGVDDKERSPRGASPPPVDQEKS